MLSATNSSVELTKAGTLFYQNLQATNVNIGDFVDFMSKKLLILANICWLFENIVWVWFFEAQCSFIIPALLCISC